MTTDFHFSFFWKKLKFDTDFLFSFFYVQKKIKIEHRFSFSLFHFSTSKKTKIEHRFSFFTFLCLKKNENWKSIVNFYFSFKKKWKMNTDFLFSFFNLRKKWMTLIYTHFKRSFFMWLFFFKKNEQKTQEHKQGIYNYIFYLFTLSFYFIAGLPRARSARGTEPHRADYQKEGRGVSGMSWQIHVFYIGHSQYGQLTAVKTG